MPQEIYDTSSNNTTTIVNDGSLIHTGNELLDFIERVANSSPLVVSILVNVGLIFLIWKWYKRMIKLSKRNGRWRETMIFVMTECGKNEADIKQALAETEKW